MVDCEESIVLRSKESGLIIIWCEFGVWFVVWGCGSSDWVVPLFVPVRHLLQRNW